MTELGLDFGRHVCNIESYGSWKRDAYPYGKSDNWECSCGMWTQYVNKSRANVRRPSTITLRRRRLTPLILRPIVSVDRR